MVMMPVRILRRTFGLASATGIAGTGAAGCGGVSIAIVQIAVYAFAW